MRPAITGMGKCATGDNKCTNVCDHASSGEGDIVLCGCRHPCLEQQDDIAFISNDVSLKRGINII